MAGNQAMKTNSSALLSTHPNTNWVHQRQANMTSSGQSTPCSLKYNWAADGRGLASLSGSPWSRCNNNYYAHEPPNDLSIAAACFWFCVRNLRRYLVRPHQFIVCPSYSKLVRDTLLSITYYMSHTNWQHMRNNHRTTSTGAACDFIFTFYSCRSNSRGARKTRRDGESLADAVWTHRALRWSRLDHHPSVGAQRDQYAIARLITVDGQIWWMRAVHSLSWWVSQIKTTSSALLK